MFKHVVVDIENLSISGKNFKWKRPKCPNGCKKVWGHGYRIRYFSGFREGVYLKRYRCPTCGTIIIMFPIGYWKHYQSSIKDIFLILQWRLTSYRWPSWTTRQRAGHWLKKFILHVGMEYGLNFEDILAKLKLLYKKETFFLGQKI